MRVYMVLKIKRGLVLGLEVFLDFKYNFLEDLVDFLVFRFLRILCFFRLNFFFLFILF